MNININQTSEATSIIEKTVINKIYNLVNKNIQGITNNILNFRGKIKFNGYTYDTYLELINANILDLTILVEGTYIKFADTNVENILINNFAKVENINYDGVPANLTFVNTLNTNNTGFKQKFKGNTSIEYFEELSKLTNFKTFRPSEFEGCTNLKSIDLQKIENISSKCFSGCTNLVTINKNNLANDDDLYCPNLKTLGSQSFKGLSKTPQRIMNLGNLTTMPESCFQDNTALTYIDPDEFMKINTFDSQCFRDCSNLVIEAPIDNDNNEINIFQNVQSFNGHNHFTGSIINIQEIKFNSILSGSFENVFNGQTNIKKIDFGDTSINLIALCGMSNLEKLILPNTINTIGTQAFYNVPKIYNDPDIKTNLNKLFLNVNRMASKVFGSYDEIFDITTRYNNGILYFKNLIDFQDSLSGVKYNQLYMPKYTNIDRYDRTLDSFVNNNIPDGDIFQYLQNIYDNNSLSDSEKLTSLNNFFRISNSINRTGYDRNFQDRWSLFCTCTNSNKQQFINYNNLIYLKNIQSIYAGAFGITYTHYIDTSNDSGKLSGFQPLPTNGSHLNEQDLFIFIKYLVINNTTTLPKIKNSCFNYSNKCLISRYLIKKVGSNLPNISNLVLRKSLLNYNSTSNKWELASNPNNMYDDYIKIVYYETASSGTGIVLENETVNLIPLESMPHVATYNDWVAVHEQYEASPSKINGITEILIEEYMDDNTIVWDANTEVTLADYPAAS